MKTAGIILILFSGTGLGLCKSMELTARLKILEKLAQLLLLLKGGNPLHRGDVGRCLS